MPKFTHKPLEVFAIQYTGDNAEEIEKLFEGLYPGNSNSDTNIIPKCREYLIISNYYIIEYDGNGTVMSVKEFEERYEPAN